MNPRRLSPRTLRGPRPSVRDRAEQDRERGTAAQLREDRGWVVATPSGRPLNPRTDFTNWKPQAAEDDDAGSRGEARPGVWPGQVAVEVGFEPTEAFTSHAFEV